MITFWLEINISLNVASSIQKISKMGPMASDSANSYLQFKMLLLKKYSL